MGIFDSDSNEEVEISPDEQESRGESRLKDEVEKEIVGQEQEDRKPEKSENSRGKAIRERSKSKGKSSFKSGEEIGLKDIHDQNKRIIGLLEEIVDDESEENETKNDATGDLNGVL